MLKKLNRKGRGAVTSEKLKVTSRKSNYEFWIQVLRIRNTEYTEETRMDTERNRIARIYLNKYNRNGATDATE